MRNGCSGLRKGCATPGGTNRNLGALLDSERRLFGLSAPQHGQSRPKILLDGRRNIANTQSFTFAANQPADFRHGGIIICQQRLCPFGEGMSSVRGTHPGRGSFQYAPTKFEFE